MSSIVKGFRMPAANSGAACSRGRRPKASKGANRGNGNVWACRERHGIRAPRIRRLRGGETIRRIFRRPARCYAGRTLTPTAQFLCNTRTGSKTIAVRLGLTSGVAGLGRSPKR